MKVVSPTNRPRRAGIALAVGLLAVLSCLVVAGPSLGATTKPPAKSRPTWLPVHTAFGLDCAGHNPGCTASRSFFSIDVIPSGQFGSHGSPSHARVYAMGGGTVHYGDAHGAACGSSSRNTFGTWIYITHPDGITSRYGHLGKILVKNGRRVAAGTPIGIVGASGKTSNCSVHYLDFSVEKGTNFTHTNRISTLKACTTPGKLRVWPRQANARKSLHSRHVVHYAKWIDAPHGTQFPASSGACIAKS